MTFTDSSHAQMRPSGLRRLSSPKESGDGAFNYSSDDFMVDQIDDDRLESVESDLMPTNTPPEVLQQRRTEPRSSQDRPTAESTSRQTNSAPAYGAENNNNSIEDDDEYHNSDNSSEDNDENDNSDNSDEDDDDGFPDLPVFEGLLALRQHYRQMIWDIIAEIPQQRATLSVIVAEFC